MFGGQLVQSYAESPNGLSYQTGANSEVFNKYDFVTLASGMLAVISGPTDLPIGLCDCTETMTSDNETVAQVQVPFYSAFNDFMFEADFSATGRAAANVGTFYTLTGSTGAMLVDAASGDATAGQVVLMKFDPRADGSLVRGLFRFAKTFQGYTVAT